MMKENPVLVTASLGISDHPKRALSRSWQRALGFSVIIFTLVLHSSLGAENKIPDEYKTGSFFIGCQSYTFYHFTVFEAIERTAEAGGKVTEACGLFAHLERTYH
jgi:hypothetical protein